MKRTTNFPGSAAAIAAVVLLFFAAPLFGEVSTRDRFDLTSNSAHLMGVVTYRDFQRGLLFVQDSAGGVAVEYKGSEPDIQPGTTVQVVGAVSQGTLAPVITKAKVTTMGPGKLPLPRPTSRWKLSTGMEESQWVELPGVIQNVTVSNQVAVLDIGSSKSHFTAQIAAKNESEVQALTKLIDASCRFRGVAIASFNANGQLGDVRLGIPASDQIILEKPAVDIDELPVTRIRNLSQFLPVTGNVHRVRIRGVVNWQRLGRGLSVQDESDGVGVYIQSTQSILLRAGDVVEAVGFVDRSQFSPYLHWSTLRKIGSGPAPVAKISTAEDLLQGLRDYQLVRVEGDLAEKHMQDGDLVLTLREGQHLFNAHLHETKASALGELEVGTRLKLTGVCWVLVDEKLKPRNFRLMMRSPTDIVTTIKPGWWTFQRVMILLTVMAFVLLLALVWAVTLRRKVTENTNRLRQQFEREAAFAALGHKLSAAMTPKDAGRIILETAQGIFGWDAGFIRLHDGKNKNAESILDVDTIDGKRTELQLPPEENLVSPTMRKVFTEGPQLILRKSTDQPGQEFTPFGDKNRRSASLMYVPLRDSMKVVGMISIQSYTPDAYDREDLERLQKLADHCGAALQRIWAQELVRKTNAELEQRVQQRTAELAHANERLHQEIEKHKRTEAALAKEQQLLHNFMETVPDSVYFKDKQGRFILVNQEKLRRFNLRDTSQIYGKTDFDFFNADDARRMQTDEEQIIATGQPILAREEKLVRLDGSITWMLTTKMALRNEEGEIVGTFGITRDVSFQKKSEQTLNYSQHLLKTIMNYVPDYIYFKDLEGHFMRVNTAFANQFGNCEPDEMLGKTDFDFLNKEAAEQSREDEQRIIRTGKPLIGKEEHEIWLDGREWWVLTSKMPFRDENGRIIGTFGVTRDITQRKRAEEALHQAQLQLEHRVDERTADLMRTNERLLAEIGDRIEAELRTSIFSNLGYWLSGVTQAPEAARTVLDAADQLLGWDAAYVHLFTPEPRRVIPILIYDTIDGKRTVLSDDGGELISERDRRVIEKGSELILRKSTDDTELIPFGSGRPSQSLIFVPIRNGTNVIGAMSIQSYTPDAYTEKDLGTLQSLADFCAGTLERILTEQALRKSEEHFSKAFLSSPTAMTLSTLKDGRYLDVNDAMLELMGFTREEMLGKTSLELGIWATPEQRGRLIDAVAKNRSIKDMEFELRTKSGQIRKTMLSAELMDFGSEPVILVSVYDLTERLVLEERLRQSQKMEAIGQLAAGIAHDFNNILTIIQGHAALLLEINDNDNNTHEALEQVTEAAERAANLTRQLLTFSRKQRMQPRPLDLNEVINSTSKMLQRILGESITLTFNHSPGLPSISGDSSMLEQVLLNLTLNARDAMTEGGKFIITTDAVTIDPAEAAQKLEAQPGNFVRLTISDTGSGMSQTMLGKIFEPFFTTKEVGKGTGLGLATVYGIVKQHHGWVEVESAIGRGTTFKIYLPSVDKQVRTIRDIPVPTTVTSGGTETILIVEDEPALRGLVRNILEVYGYHVIEAAHGKEALGVWEKNKSRIDLLLTDIVMPEGISGIDLAEMLRKDTPELKVIFTSGYSVELFKNRQPLVEGRNFLPKPYQPRLLAQTIRSCFDEVKNSAEGK